MTHGLMAPKELGSQQVHVEILTLDRCQKINQ